MDSRLPVGIIGIGRMGAVHARHLLELEREDGLCRLAALVDIDPERIRRFREATGCDAPAFSSLEEYIGAAPAQATLVATPTEHHRSHAAALAAAGHRVLLEKPLTGSLAGDEAFCAELDRTAPNAVMLAFQRRFDAALNHGRNLAASGAIGRVFKIYSALEDSSPAPDGYQSDGILPDMSVHNVDEILWLTGRIPDRAASIGCSIYSQALTTCKEDADDALLLLWFGDDLHAQVQVSRNHVSGYRVETVIYGDQGQIQIGHFDQRTDQISVVAYGRRGSAEPISSRTFPGGAATSDSPEFVARFGPAYKAEAAEFLRRVQSGEPFAIRHTDGLNAQRVIASAKRWE